jgi:hypothetical protein
MVKDYKRLHHLDFADADLDDSDGGYSDYQMSEQEAEDPPEKADSKELLPGQYQWQSTFLGLSLSHETGQTVRRFLYFPCPYRCVLCLLVFHAFFPPQFSFSISVFFCYLHLCENVCWLSFNLM